MRLTARELALLRPFDWTIVHVGDRVYNSVVSEKQTRLFWLDFVRLVLVPKFRKQRGVTRLANMDLTQPVLLTDDLHLVVPDAIESIAYYADNMDSPPMRFALEASSIAFTAIGCVVLLAVAVAALFSSKRTTDRLSRFVI